MFVSTSLSGVTLLWNLNQCLDDPVAEVNLGEPIQKILWSKDGHQVSLMDGNGGVQIFDVHESLYNVKQNEWDVLARYVMTIKCLSILLLVFCMSLFKTPNLYSLKNPRQPRHKLCSHVQTKSPEASFVLNLCLITL